MKRIFLTCLLLAFIILSLSANNRSNLTGRQIVDIGKLKTFTGVLEEEDLEWYLKTDEKTYALHLGYEAFLKEQNINLQSGTIAEIKGFVFETDIAVATIKNEEKIWILRDNNGRPSWAGNGQGRNKKENE